MKILDGKATAASWQKSLAKRLAGKRLDAIVVGDSPASLMYLKKKGEMAAALGADFQLHRFPAQATTKQIANKLAELNRDQSVSGIMIQLPLPASLDETVIEQIAPHKDVDGLTLASLESGRFLPATARGILQLLGSYGIALEARSIALVGFTRLLNVALSVRLSSLGNEVIILQKGSKDFSRLKSADIIITATGVPKLIKSQHVGKGAVVVDAGIAKVGEKIVGDVDFETVKESCELVDAGAGWGGTDDGSGTIC